MASRLVILRLATLGSLALAGASCSDSSVAGPLAQAPSFTISDGAHGGNARLYFLPPLVTPAPSYSGTFDASAFAQGSFDEVYVCQIAGFTCGTILSFGPADVRLDRVAETYTVIWHTRSANLIPGLFYRIVVKVGGQDLGYADVAVLQNGAAKQTAPANFVPVIAGTTVAIQFRLEVATTPPPPPSAGGSTITANGFWGSMCGLTGNTAYCWGADNYGQLGDGVVSGPKLPVAVIGSHAFASITDGGNHTCGLTLAGAAYCWGSNGSGELGNAAEPVGVNEYSATPVLVSGGLTFTSLTAGFSYTCGLTPGEEAYCWGDNTWGQLGDGANTNQPTPVAVAGNHHFRALSAGAYHACAIDVNSNTYCWGRSQYGEAGSGGNFPIGLATPAFASLSAGTWHNCGLQLGGQAFCWGYNLTGQLGNGTNLNSPSAVAVTLPPNAVFTSVSAGFSHSCGLATGGLAYCWGADQAGQLGDANYSGPNYASYKPTPQLVSGGLTWSEITAGWANSCARTTAGAVYCWGANASWSTSGQYNTAFEPRLFLP